MRIGLIFGFILTSIGLFAQVDVITPGKFTVTKNSTDLSIRYESNHDLGTADAGLKYAVISLHGVNRNADDYYSNMLVAANQNPVNRDSTLIIAPQFLTETDINSYSLSTDHLYWSSGGWSAGSLSRDQSSNPRPERISSYQIMDSLITTIAEMGINIITLVGHSAGGQFVQRHAATSQVLDGEDLDFDVKYVVMNPSSYVYMDNKRRVGSSTTTFDVPGGGCAEYNEWKFGLDDLFSYPSAKGATDIRNLYRERNVVYLLGGDDNDPNDPGMDRDCEATLQGLHRLERGTVYYNYIQQYYNEATHRIDTVPGVGHSHSQMFSSPKGIFHIFESRNGYDTTTPIFSSKNEIRRLDLYPNPTNGLLTINIPSSYVLSLKVHNIFGREMLNQTFDFYSNQVELDLSDFQLGYYIISVIADDGSYVQKVFKK